MLGNHEHLCYFYASALIETTEGRAAFMNAAENKRGRKCGKEKLISISALYVLSVLIALVGAAFSIASFTEGIYFPVLSCQVPGEVFGVVILYLGIRYFFSVRKLKAEVYRPDSTFSWDNFRKNHKHKV